MNMVIGQRIVAVPSTKENVIFATNSDIKLENARKETEAEAVPLVVDHHIEGAGHLLGVEADHQFVEANHQFVVIEVKANHLFVVIEIEASRLLGEIEVSLLLQKGAVVNLYLQEKVEVDPQTKILELMATGRETEAQIRICRILQRSNELLLHLNFLGMN